MLSPPRPPEDYLAPVAPGEEADAWEDSGWPGTSSAAAGTKGKRRGSKGSKVPAGAASGFQTALSLSKAAPSGTGKKAGGRRAKPSAGSKAAAPVRDTGTVSQGYQTYTGVSVCLLGILTRPVWARIMKAVGRLGHGTSSYLPAMPVLFQLRCLSKTNHAFCLIAMLVCASEAQHRSF